MRIFGHIFMHHVLAQSFCNHFRTLLCSTSIVSTEFKSVWREAMTIIIPEESYLATLNFLGIPPLKCHHENLCDKQLCFTPTRKLLIS